MNDSSANGGPAETGGVQGGHVDDLSLFWSQALESSINGIAFGGLDKRLTWANPSFLRMFGYDDASEVIGRHVYLLAGSEERAQEVLAALCEQGAWVGETVARRKNGETFVVAMSGSLVRGADGAPVGMMASFIDITDRTRTAQALQDSEEKYRSLVESAQDPIFTSDIDGRYLYVNAAGAMMLGTTPEQVIGRTVEELFPPHVAEQYRAGVRHVIETGESLKAEDRSEIGGRLYWFSTLLQPVSRDGRIVAAQAIVRDITSLKQAEEALRESEARLRQVVRASNIGIFDHDHISQSIYWSPQQRDIWGWGPDEPVSGHDLHAVDGDRPAYLDVIHPEDRERIVEAVASAHRAGDGLFDVEYRINRRDGQQRWLSIRSQTFFEGEGDDRHPVRTVGAVRDITDDKLAEDERARLQVQLVQAHKMEAIGRLAGGVAHDFNNMLGVIIGHAELAASHVRPGDPIRIDLDEILKAAHRSADLTRQLLGFARQQTVAPKVIDLNVFLTGSLSMLRRLIGENVSLVWSPCAAVWPVRIDPSQVNQILTNLSVNARDAIADVGQVVIRTENVTLDALYCSTHQGAAPGPYVMVEVTDDGCGMDEEAQAHVFEPFYTTKPEGQGTGLGLATVYGIVKQNNGFISVSSHVGRGTTVAVFLPRVVGEAANAETRRPANAPETGTETVLVVEDELSLLRLTQTILGRLGYTVLPAATPGEAMRLAKEHAGTIHLLITDVVMPEMNGRDLAERLLAEDPSLKCLFMSGYTASVIAPGGVLDPNVHFLQKPFSPRDLAAKVRQVLAGR